MSEEIKYLVRFDLGKEDEEDEENVLLYKVVMALNEDEANALVLNSLNSANKFIGLFVDEEQALDNDLECYGIYPISRIQEVLLYGPEIYLAKYRIGRCETDPNSNGFIKSPPSWK